MREEHETNIITYTRHRSLAFRHIGNINYLYDITARLIFHLTSI